MPSAEQQVTDFFLAHHQLALRLLREHGLSSSVCASYFTALSAFATAVEPIIDDLHDGAARPRLRAITGGKVDDSVL